MFEFYLYSTCRYSMYFHFPTLAVELLLLLPCNSDGFHVTLSSYIYRISSYIYRKLKKRKYFLQEYIPVGCVPPAAVAVCWGCLPQCMLGYPLGCGPGPPWLWAWTHTHTHTHTHNPPTSPLGVGLDTPQPDP